MLKSILRDVNEGLQKDYYFHACCIDMLFEKKIVKYFFYFQMTK